MDKSMGPLLILSLIFFTSCGFELQKGKTVYGKISEADLISQKGEPTSIEKLDGNRGEILIYPEQEKYQVTNDVVVSSFKNPQADEKNLLFWKHQFKDCESTERKLPQSGHEGQEIELQCRAQGISVIYIEGSNTILRVIEYAKE